MLNLTLPGTDAVLPQKVETRPRAVAGWLDTLPYANPTQVAQQLLMALYALNRHALDGDDRAALLALYRPVVARMAASLEVQIADAGLPPTPGQRQAGTLLRELLIELAIGHKHVLQALASRRLVRASGKRVAEAAARVLGAHFDVLFACHLTRMTPPAGLWREIHQVYAYAQAAGAAELAVDDAPTPAAAYCRAVLFTRADPPHMSHAELLHTRRYLEKYADRATLAAAPLGGHPGFSIPVDGDLAPSPTPPDPARESLWLDTGVLCQHLQAVQLHLRTGDTPRRIRLPEGMEAETTQILCTHLLKQWCAGTQRAFRRHTPADATMTVVAGLGAIHRLLGAGPAPAGDEAFTPIAPPAPVTPTRWTIRNDSAAGLALAGTPGTPLNLRVGDALALQPDNTTEWSLGVIRWLRMRDAQTVEFGVERLSPRVEAVWVRPLRGHRATRAEAALFVPGIAAMQQADRLMLPRHLYQLGIEAEVTHGTRSYDVVFGKRIDPTPGFDLIDFSIFEASPE
ncbi:MAG: hypothetical protein AB1482_08360 [Pseudomonadota bacterium]